METTLPTTDQRPMDRQEFFRLVGIGVGAILLTRCVSGCAGASNSDPTPNQARKIDFTINLDDKTGENLKAKGGYIIINDVIVAQTKDGRFIAVSANCTHQGAQLVFKPSENQFYCPLHLSRFDTKGNVISGPATQALQQYTVLTNPTSGVLRVSN